MTTTAQSIGRPTGGKTINLSQMQSELQTAGIDVTTGLGMHDDYVYTYADSLPADFAETSRETVDQVIADHVAMRDKTDAEYATEFQDAATTPQRKQEIRDQQSGLLPREQVPM